MSRTTIQHLQSRIALLERQVSTLETFSDKAAFEIARLVESKNQKNEKTNSLPSGAANHLRKIAEEFVRSQSDKWKLSDGDMDDLIDVLKRNGSGISLIAFALNNDVVLTNGAHHE